MNTYQYEDITLGLEEQFEVTVTEEMMNKFFEITGDQNPLHMNADFAREKGYQNRVVYGMLTASFFSTLAGMYLPGERSLIHRVETEFPAPIYVGDHLTINGKVSELNDAFRTMILKVTIRNQDGKKVCRGKMRVGFLEDKCL